jgi:hypothetical protein
MLAENQRSIGVGGRVFLQDEWAPVLTTQAALGLQPRQPVSVRSRRSRQCLCGSAGQLVDRDKTREERIDVSRRVE